MEVNEPRAKYLTSQFKRTEAGDIPIDWIDKPIGEMAEVTSGGTPSRQVAAFWDGDIPWVTTAEIDGGQVTEASQYITAAGLQNSAAKWLPAGTLLIALYGQGKTRGKCAVLRISATTNQACAGIKLKEGVDGDFVRHNLAHRYDYIRSLSNGGSQENLSGEIVKKIRVGMPSTRAEQRAIADTLTDADALIDSLEQLLTKKRQIKQGAMQELLTGKRRLPGFFLPWRTYRLDEIADPVAQFNRDTTQLPVITCSKHLGFVDSLGFFKSQVFSNDTSTYKVVLRGQLAYPANHIEEGSIGYQDLYEEALVSPIYVVFQPRTGTNGKFLHRLLKLPQFLPVFGRLTSSSVNRRGSLRWQAFSTIEVAIPAEEEQFEVVQVIEALESEVAALEARITKARALKQAMAQALLTGRIRLPVAS